MTANLMIVFMMISTATIGERQSWHESYSAALRDVKQQDKPLFIVITAGDTDVGQEIRLGSYRDHGVREALKKDYVKLFVNTDTKMGHKIAGLFDVNEDLDQSRTVIIDRSGKWQVFSKDGKRDPTKLTGLLKRNRRVLFTVATNSPPRQSQSSVRTYSGPITSSRIIQTSPSQSYYNSSSPYSGQSVYSSSTSFQSSGYSSSYISPAQNCPS